MALLSLFGFVLALAAACFVVARATPQPRAIPVRVYDHTGRNRYAAGRQGMDGRDRP